MGYLLKEALKTLCGVNQWSYAVFWKFGSQNPKLLVWEECYYEQIQSCLGLPGLSGNEFPGTGFGDYNDSWGSVVRARDKVHLLVNKMMMDSHVVISGEGLVGRVAFTGIHHWILSDNYYNESHPPEVIKELCRQFSTGMQTIVVIPILPHGVIQFGSFLSIMENVGFVNDVTSLIVQLGLVPGVFPSEEYLAEEQGARIGVPACIGNSTSGLNLSNGLLENSTYGGYSRDIQIDPRTNDVGFQASGSTPSHQKPQDPKMAPSFSSSNQLIYGVAKAEVIPLNSEILMTRNTPFYNPSSCVANSSTEQKDLASQGSGKYHGVFHGVPKNLFPDVKQGANGSVSSQESTSIKLNNASFMKWEESKFDSVEKLIQSDDNLILADFVPGPEWGDDLFDVLGPDYKNKLFGSGSCPSSNESKKSRAWSEIYSTSQGNSGSGIFSSSRTDNLLEAVVSQSCPSAKPSVDDTASCKTTLKSSSSSSKPNDLSEASAIIKGELFGIPKYRNVSSKEESSTFSQESSLYGLQMSSWIENDRKAGQNNSASTGHSKKPHEMGKPNRKRLKPGENPRPRPKDRQMIQDRVKELREIVPNGAKCSIDSLLERTIKHMLFLQSVMKHADKLKQTRDSKVMSKDGGVTWAYEVGAQPTVCPIRVEDLNQPRQMLVEMLCEERGLFLEIADVIRGLGLTILKGVMETQKNKIWSRFTVEANRDVTRMEIFMSLVHLLEQSAKAQPDNNSENLVMAQQLNPIDVSPNLQGSDPHNHQNGSGRVESELHIKPKLAMTNMSPSNLVLTSLSS